MADIILNDIINQIKLKNNPIKVENDNKLLPLFKEPIESNNETYILKNQDNSKLNYNFKSLKIKVKKSFINTSVSSINKEDSLNNTEINLNLLSDKEKENIKILKEFTNDDTVSLYYYISLFIKLKKLNLIKKRVERTENKKVIAKAFKNNFIQMNLKKSIPLKKSLILLNRILNLNLLNKKINSINNSLNNIKFKFYLNNKLDLKNIICKLNLLSNEIENFVINKPYCSIKDIEKENFSFNSSKNSQIPQTIKESNNIFNVQENIISLVDSNFYNYKKSLENLNKKKIEHTVLAILKSKLLKFNFYKDSVTVNSNPMKYLSFIKRKNTTCSPIIASQSNYLDLKEQGKIEWNKNTFLKKSEISILQTENDNRIRKFLFNMRVIFMARSQKNMHKVVNYSLKNFDSGAVTKSNLVYDEAYKLLQSVFKSMYCYISKPIFKITTNKIRIQLFYYLNIPSPLKYKWFALNHIIKKKLKSKTINTKNGTIIRSYKYKVILKKIRHKKKVFIYPLKFFNRRKSILKTNRLFFIDKFFNLNNQNLAFIFPCKFKILLNILSQFFKKHVELELIRLHHPQLDSNILATFLAYIASYKNIHRSVFNIFRKKYSVKKINFKFKPHFKNIPSFLSGFNIKLAGRLIRGPVASRVKTYLFSKGANSPGKVNVSDTARVTKKSKRGTFSLTVKSSHNFY
uniref:hypothetical protein n=1 Tax=Squamanita imbachii TaxID=2976389 RepID=UPI0030E0363F